MDSKHRIVRDFIYIDIDRLYSFYSQVFEGVADQIVQSYLNSSKTTDFQKASPLKGKAIEAQIAEASYRTESKILYDHMYNQLEERISNAILSFKEVNEHNFQAKLRDYSLIKVQGKAEIEDYKRMSHFMEKFNLLAEAIAYAIISSSTSDQATELKKIIKKEKDKNKKFKLKENLKKLTDAKSFAKEMGLSQDEKLLSNLKLFSDMFNPDGYEITLTPNTKENIVYRAIIDKQWLRIKPEFLRALYGGYVDFEWTMVGQITYLPGTEIPNPIESNEDDSTEIKADEQPFMRDAFRNMFVTSLGLEKMFLESKERIEVIICPLAIYREISISDPKR